MKIQSVRQKRKITNWNICSWAVSFESSLVHHGRSDLPYIPLKSEVTSCSCKWIVMPKSGHCLSFVSFSVPSFGRTFNFLCEICDSVKRQSERQHSAHAGAICRYTVLLNAEHYLPSYFRRTAGRIFDRRLVLNLHPPPSLASLGSCCVSCPGCKGYGLRLYIAQMNWIPGSVACHSEEQWDVKAREPWGKEGEGGGKK